MEKRIVNDEPKIQNPTNHGPYNNITQLNQFIYQSVALSVCKSNIFHEVRPYSYWMTPAHTWTHTVHI